MHNVGEKLRQGKRVAQRRAAATQGMSKGLRSRVKLNFTIPQKCQKNCGTKLEKPRGNALDNYVDAHQHDL